MSEIDHRAFGAHSNIPDCCIEYFMTDWKQEGRTRDRERHKGWGYVPCNDCLDKGDRAVIHLCGLECAETLINFGFSIENVAAIISINILDGAVNTYGGGRVMSYTFSQHDKIFAISNLKG